MEIRRSVLLLLVFLVVGFSAHTQSWQDLIDRRANFYDIQSSARDYFSRQQGEKIPGLNQFSRWEYMMEQRVYPSGEWPASDQAMREYKRVSKEEQNARQQSYPAWTSKGPNNIANLSGLGRVNFIRIHPTNPNILYAGTPAGGLWKSTDGGTTFIVLNDTLPSIGCADLAINPLNDSILYLGTGDRVGTSESPYSDGVWKSTDAGNSWNPTGLSFNLNQFVHITRMAINPLNPQVVFAATMGGIYKTKDGGDNWAMVRTGNFFDIEMMPGDTSYIYAGGAQYVRSTDGGENFSFITVVPSTPRMELAVSPANPAKVYIVACETGNYSLQGIYVSQDSGLSFVQVHDGDPNLLGRTVDGSDLTTGQSWYDLDIAVSPIDEDFILVAGINIWKSMDGGATFTFSSYENGIPNSALIHVDIHYLTFSNDGSFILVGNDGGVYKSLDSGTTWTDISNSLVITQSYRIGLNKITPDWFLMGNQDNGTFYRKSLFGYFHVTGGDGMECIISHTDQNLMFSTYQNGILNRSIDGGNSFNSVFSPAQVSESGDWVTPYIMDPFIEDVLYIGYRNIYKTTNKGSNWTKVNNNSFPGGGNTKTMAIHSWWPDRIVASKTRYLYYSEDGGVNWAQITKPNNPNLTISYVAFDNNDLSGETIWVTYSGYEDAKKAFKTTDLGATWTNESTGLPNVPVNCVLIDNEGTGGGVYVGTDIGVFYQEDSLGSFVSYSNGLPNVMVMEMDIQPVTKKIIAGTHGRGIWEVDLLTTGLKKKENQGKLGMVVWPNPVKDIINVRLTAAKGSGVLSISDFKGSTLFSHTLDLSDGINETSLDMRNAGLTPGIYLLRLEADGHQISKKIIVQ